METSSLGFQNTLSAWKGGVFELLFQGLFEIQLTIGMSNASIQTYCPAAMPMDHS